MNDRRFTSTFLALLIFFVFSILIFINFSDLFMLMLGWDGLGVVSFFLVIFYQTRNSIFSGLITVFTNRLGDCFLIILIAQYALYLPHFYSWSIISPPSIFFIFLLFASSFTKSAIFPFSS
jgi:NADH-ubiquinone oxidoreductase chain 5